MITITRDDLARSIAALSFYSTTWDEKGFGTVANDYKETLNTMVNAWLLLADVQSDIHISLDGEDVDECGGGVCPIAPADDADDGMVEV